MEKPKLDERHKRIIELINPKPKDKILVIGTGFYPKMEYLLFSEFKCSNIISGDIDKRNLTNGKNILPDLEFIFLDALKKDSHLKIIFLIR